MIAGIQEYAQDLGYEVVLAKSPREALTRNNERISQGGYFTVMIVDLQLGKDDEFKGGWEFLEKAEMNNSTVVVVMTKHADPHRIEVPLKIPHRALWTFKLKYDVDDVQAVYDLLKTQASGTTHDQGLVAESQSDLAILDDLPQIAASGLPVLITGPSGSSKEHFAMPSPI